MSYDSKQVHTKSQHKQTTTYIQRGEERSYIGGFGDQGNFGARVEGSLIELETMAINSQHIGAFGNLNDTIGVGADNIIGSTPPGLQLAREEMEPRVVKEHPVPFLKSLVSNLAIMDDLHALLDQLDNIVGILSCLFKLTYLQTS